MRALVTDIETEPLSEDFLRTIYPGFPEFDATAVRYGNLKDPAKKIAKFEAALSEWEKERDEHWAEFVNGATLKAHTSRVCAIGYYDGTEYSTVFGDEKLMLEGFWEQYKAIRRANGRIIGHNLLGFDLPFIRQRSFVNGVQVPKGVIDKERFWSQQFVDTMQVWSSGVYPQAKVSLDAMSKLLGGPGKLGKGGDFHKLLKTDPNAAREYLRRDLQEGWRVAKAFGVLDD